MMIIKEIVSNFYNECCSCHAHISSLPKDVDKIMGGKVADKIFELTVDNFSVKLCDECLKDLRNMIDELEV